MPQRRQRQSRTPPPRTWLQQLQARRNLDEHLVCDKARLATKLIAQAGRGPAAPGDEGTPIAPEQAKHVPIEGLYVANQFGVSSFGLGAEVPSAVSPERLDTVKEAELCIPSRIVVPRADQIETSAASPVGEIDPEGVRAHLAGSGREQDRRQGGPSEEGLGHAENLV